MEAEAGVGGGGGADSDALVGHVADVAEIGEEGDSLPHGEFAEDVELAEAGGVVVGLGSDAGAGDGAAVLVVAPRPVESDIVAGAGEAQAPGGAAGNLVEAGAAEKALGGVGAFEAAVGEDLEAAGPRGEKGEGLTVAEIEAFDAEGAGNVALGADVVAGEFAGIEAVEGEEVGRGGEDGGAEEILEVAAEGADGNLTDAGEIILGADFDGVGGPGFDGGVVDDDAVVGGRRVIGVGKVLDFVRIC